MTYPEKKAQAILQMKLLTKSKGEQITLKPKATKHFFRFRNKKKTIDLRNFNKIISVDSNNLTAEVEGLTTFYDIVDETLKYGLIPEVIPDLRAITIGGAISGLGLESTSFKYGTVHETLESFEIITGGGILNCSAIENEDLFRTVPNSLGTLGYILKAKIKLMKASDYVKIDLIRFSTAESYFEAMKDYVNERKVDFIDGAIFSIDNYVLVIGTFIDKKPKKLSSPNLTLTPYYKLLKNIELGSFYLKTKDYIWRWDKDVFWGTDQGNLLLNFLFNNRSIRLILGNLYLRSDRLIRLKRKVKDLAYKYKFLENKKMVQLLQDVGVEIDKCSEFIRWYDKKINIYPIWACPVIKTRSDETYPMYKWQGKIILDIGFYSNKEIKDDLPRNYYDVLIEKELIELNGTKGLHSTVFFNEEEFWRMFDKEKYDEAKAKYDPNKIFPNIYIKVAGESKASI